MRRLTIDIFIEIAKSKEGKCLSTVYKNCKTELHFECKLGHQWKTAAANVRDGYWCPKCGYEKVASAKRHTIEYMQQIGISRGGKCRSEIYVDSHSDLEWECSVGHIWSAVPTSILRGSWCPQCSRFISERICRAYFEAIFGEKFPKIRPQWMKTHVKGGLELDGYCEKLGIAFEHQGVQHYLASKQFLNDGTQLELIQNRDCLKRQLRKNNQIALIEIPALGYYTKIKDLEALIFIELSKHDIFPSIARPIKVDWKSIYTSEDLQHLEKLKEAALLKGGKLLSTEYSGGHGEYDFDCGKGHVFTAKGYAITSNGTWCFDCRSENSGKTQRKKILHVETGNVYVSLNEVCRKLGLLAPNASAAIKGRRPHSKGFTLKYVDS